MVSDDTLRADATRAREAERALLGAVFIDPGVLPAIADLPAEAFGAAHSLVLAAMREIAAADSVPDLVTVSRRMEQGGDLAKIGGFSTLADLSAAMPTAANASHYANLVRDAWARRRAVRALEAALASVRDGTAEPQEAAAKATEAVQALTETRGASCVLLSDVLASRYDAYQAAAEGRTPPAIATTGFPGLDKRAMPWEPGDLVVLSAGGTGTGSGKTSLALQMSAAVALGGQRVLYGAAEMSAAAMGDRHFVQQTGVDLWRARHGRLGDREWAPLVEAMAASGGFGRRLWIDDSIRTSWDVIARAQRLTAEHGRLALIVVDHLHQLADRAARGQESRADLLGAMVRRLKALAMDLGCVVLLVAQTNRAGRRAAEDRDPDAGDLKGSGDIEDQADEVLMIRHGKEQPGRPMQPVRIIVAKHRAGPTGSVDLWWDATQARFCSIHAGEPPARRGDDPGD